jgi:hypothetical protein
MTGSGAMATRTAAREVFDECSPRMLRARLEFHPNRSKRRFPFRRLQTFHHVDLVSTGPL